MTEDPKIPALPIAAPPARATRGPWRWMLGLLLLGGIAGGGAWFYARISSIYLAQTEALQGAIRDLNALEVQANRLESRQGDLAAAEQRSASELAEFGARIDGHDQIVGQL